MHHDLFKFWRRLTPDIFPRIHPDDVKTLTKFPQKLASPTSWNEFIKKFGGKNEKSNKKLQTSLVPVPYWGDFEKASIVFLMLNPGFLPVNVWAEMWFLTGVKDYLFMGNYPRNLFY